MKNNFDYFLTPRLIYRAYLDRKLSYNEWIVLHWIFSTTNPMTGRCDVTYKGLSEYLSKKITEGNLRRIVTSLRNQNWIWFESHRGSGKPFAVYPAYFRLSDKTMQIVINGELSAIPTNQARAPTKIPNEAGNNLQDANHNFDKNKHQLAVGLSADRPRTAITTSNDTNKNDDKNGNEIIDTRTYKAITSEEYECLEIAKYLQETDMRFILSRLKSLGMNRLRYSYSLTKEAIQKGGVRNPGAYFNRMVDNPPP